MAALYRYLQENRHSPLLLPAANKAEDWSELSRNGKVLTLSYGTPEGTLEEALRLLKEMALLLEDVLVSKSLRYQLA